MENKSHQLVVFTLNEQRCALHLSTVERAFRIVEITPLPKAPEIVLGVVNVHGRVIPVVNIRRRFGLPDREMRLTDQLIIARTPKRVIAPLVDSVIGVAEYPEEEVIKAEKILPGLEYVEGVVKLEDGLILIHDLDKLLSLDEEKSLDEVMR